MSTESAKEKAAKEKAAKLKSFVVDESTFTRTNAAKWSDKKYKTETGGSSNHTLPGMSRIGVVTRIKRLGRKNRK
tara:strand:- start:163 stop:387 length:225 start_codon:yes stop_codon:yes gene_type:complete